MSELKKDLNELKHLYSNQKKTLSDYRVYQPYWDFVKKNIDEQAKQPQQPPQGQNNQPHP